MVGNLEVRVISNRQKEGINTQQQRQVHRSTQYRANALDGPKIAKACVNFQMFIYY